MNDCYLSIDIETTGLDPERDQILEIGAVLDDGQGDLNEKPHFHCYVSHPRYEGSAFALAMNSEILLELARHEQGDSDAKVLPVGQVAKALRNFVRLHVPTGKVTPAGKNFSGFDRQFLQRLPHWKPLFRHRTIDPGVLWWKPEQDGFTLPNSDEVSRRVGGTGETIHRALFDALDTCQAVRKAIRGQNHHPWQSASHPQ